jgi:putative transposase
MGMTATKKRHSPAEIVAKLNQADEWAQAGRTQGDIARALEVSVMTFHRWRKAHPKRATAQPVRLPEPGPVADQNERIAELQLENSRLRRMVTDLLLEKIKLEEDGHDSPREPANFGSAMPRLVGSK